MEFYAREKFGSQQVKEKLREFGFSGGYGRILVCWQVADSGVVEYARRSGIEVWELRQKIGELTDRIGDSYYPDEILRTLQLVKKSEMMKGRTDERRPSSRARVTGIPAYVPGKKCGRGNHSFKTFGNYAVCSKCGSRKTLAG